MALLMKVDEIIALIEKDSKSSQSTGRVLLIAGGSLLIAGAALAFLFTGGTKTAGYIVLGIGLMAGLVGWLSLKGSKALAADALYVRNVLLQSPADLVWGYVYEYHHKGNMLQQVKICFRNGTLVVINKDDLPGKDMDGFLNMLKREYNTAMIIGFSEELEFKFNNKLF